MQGFFNINPNANDNWKFQLIVIIPIVDLKTRVFCKLPYPDHPKGCPNFDSNRIDCPPIAPLFNKIFNLQNRIYAVINEFNLKSHTEKMKYLHPTWTDRQCRNLLYWQNSARKQLKMKVNYFLNYTDEYSSFPPRKDEGYEAIYIPEAMGIDVTKTMEKAGVILEWPPINIVRQIAFLAKRK